jgi:hypothetical protein
MTRVDDLAMHHLQEVLLQLDRLMDMMHRHPQGMGSIHLVLAALRVGHPLTHLGHTVVHQPLRKAPVDMVTPHHRDLLDREAMDHFQVGMAHLLHLNMAALHHPMGLLQDMAHLLHMGDQMDLLQTRMDHRMDTAVHHLSVPALTIGMKADMAVTDGMMTETETEIGTDDATEADASHTD